MKSLLIAALFLLPLPGLKAQPKLTLDECYERARENYPLVRQAELIKSSTDLSVKNAAQAALPQVILGGQATYQSEVTQIPVEMPGVEPLSKDQYRVYGEISQNLYNGGLARHQQQYEQMAGGVEQIKLDVELYQLKNRINSLFFGIILLQEQIAQSALVKEDLSAGLRKTQAAISNGVALQSSADVLYAEILRADQRIIELRSLKENYIKTLAMFVNLPLDESTQLETPSIGSTEGVGSRPELALYDFQKENIEISRAVLAARKKPRLELFLQAGYGRPALNMLENEFSFYYLGGIRFSWSLSGFYTYGREKQLLTLRQQTVDVQREAFLFNTGVALNQHDAEIKKLAQLILVDEQIVNLRTKVKQTAAVQLEQGVIASNDYIREVNAEDRAKQDLVLHETQWLMAKASHQFTSGN